MNTHFWKFVTQRLAEKKWGLSFIPVIICLVALPARATPLSDCIAACSEERDTCISDAHSGPARGLCVGALNACTNTCRRNFPAPPPIPRVDSVQPLWGWSGDKIRVSGNNLFKPNLAITIGGLPADIVSSNKGISRRAWDIIDLRVPVLRDDIRGPVSYPVVITTDNKTFQYTFSYSPVIIGQDTREFQSSGPFLSSGYVSATAELNRETGQITARTSARAYNGLFDSLPYSVAILYFDIDGKPVGSVETHEFNATGVNFNGQPVEFNANWTDAIRPAPSLNTSAVNQIRFAVVRVSNKSKNELETQVMNIVNMGKTMAEALKIFVGL